MWLKEVNNERKTSRRDYKTPNKNKKQHICLLYCDLYDSRIYNSKGDKLMTNQPEPLYQLKPNTKITTTYNKESNEYKVWLSNSSGGDLLGSFNSSLFDEYFVPVDEVEVTRQLTEYQKEKVKTTLTHYRNAKIESQADQLREIKWAINRIEHHLDNPIEVIEKLDNTEVGAITQGETDER